MVNQGAKPCEEDAFDGLGHTERRLGVRLQAQEESHRDVRDRPRPSSGRGSAEMLRAMPCGVISCKKGASSATDGSRDTSRSKKGNQDTAKIRQIMRRKRIRCTKWNWIWKVIWKPPREDEGRSSEKESVLFYPPPPHQNSTRGETHMPRHLMKKPYLF